MENQPKSYYHSVCTCTKRKLPTPYVDILDRGRQTYTDHSKNLAGVIEKQFLLGEDDRKHIEFCKTRFGHTFAKVALYHGEEVKVVSMHLDEVWINIMKPGDFNPPHNHIGGDISFVLHLQVSSGSGEEYNNKSNLARVALAQ